MTSNIESEEVSFKAVRDSTEGNFVKGCINRVTRCDYFQNSSGHPMYKGKRG